MIGSVSLAFLAGVVSILSPCVLPLVPIIFGAAAAEHRLGPVALAGGLALSFTSIGLFVAVVGFSIGLDLEFFRALAAVLFVAVGLVLAVPAFQERLALATGPMSNWTNERFGVLSASVLNGQFALGLVLGAVWIPCVGPTLGAASLLAARGESLLAVGATMAAFGLGAALPLALFGTLSRQALLRWRSRLAGAGKLITVALGAVLIVVGGAILSGYDRAIEAALVEASPDWLTELTTRY
ncbi:MAG: cytochrome c biogenesis CcdA family protein [Bauldia sp.]